MGKVPRLCIIKGSIVLMRQALHKSALSLYQDL